MYERVNPEHPDKLADRVAGAIVDLAYSKNDKARIAVEINIGHGRCFIIIETNVNIFRKEIVSIIHRIVGDMIKVDLISIRQDKNLAKNQKYHVRCGDNGIFKGIKVDEEEKKLTELAYNIYTKHPYDGKYIINDGKLTICQSNTDSKLLRNEFTNAVVNPLGDWYGGINVDTGAVNRKLGSDMGDSVTGGGLHGKDLSKPDVTLSIYAWLKSQITNKEVNLNCAIGDRVVDNRKYSEIVRIAKKYIQELGGFEKFAEWGLIRPKELDVNLLNYEKYFVDR